MVRRTIATSHLFRLLVGLTAAAAVVAGLSGAAPKFYDDDPITQEIDTEDASGVLPWTIGVFYEGVEKLFSKPGDPAPDVRAQNINSVDDVPDSVAWFTNRLGTRSVTVEEVAKGPDTTSGPAPGKWEVASAKSDGITPGFTVTDTLGQRWFIKFDPKGYEGMATGSEVAVTKLVWALGYYVPETHITRLRPDELEIAEGATVEPFGAPKRQMKLSDIGDLLRVASRGEDGSYRVIASKALEHTLGPFRYYGTRPDDPNDIVPHEHRRELRGLRVFAAWLNHGDSKDGNTLDTLVTENTRAVVRHHLIDFGSTLGSAAVFPREPWVGYEYAYEGTSTGKSLASLGFWIPKWKTIDFDVNPAIGRYEKNQEEWNPEEWKPRIPNSAYIRARADDKFWAARKLMAMSDDMIKVAIKAGQFVDPEAADFLVNALIARRQIIGARYLTTINPIVNPALSASGELTFGNIAAELRMAETPASYKAAWSSFDNALQTRAPIGESSGSGGRIQAPPNLPTAPGAYILVEISAVKPAIAAWERPVHVYFRRVADGWKLVGFERLPDPLS